jgi:hypothetical protein
MHERSQTDRILMAKLQGIAVRHARWHEPTEAETAAAVAELAGILAGRDDAPALLAEAAGLLTGYHEGGLDEPRARAAARFLTEAGADPELIGLWVEEGRRRNRWPTSPRAACDRPG